MLKLKIKKEKKIKPINKNKQKSILMFKQNNQKT